MSAANTGPATFVKSADTRTSASASQAEIEKMVRRYGCTAFLVEQDYAARTARVRFTLPLTPGQGEPVRVEIVVDPRRVKSRLPKGASDDRVERVAWRHVVLWIDAALSLAAAGLQTVDEAFLAHTLVRTRDGAEGRMIDYLHTLSAGTNMYPALGAGRGAT